MACKITATAKDKTVHCIINRPGWEDMRVSYQNLANDATTSEVFASLFGSDYNKVTFNNSCAARVSLSLLNVGVNDAGNSFNVMNKESPFRGKGITVSAVKMREFFKKKWGNPEVPIFKTRDTTTLADLQKEIGARKGVFSFVASDPKAFGASGHITLWNGDGVISGEKYANLAYADGNPGSVCLWELK